jgi:hypothetical protein
VIIIITGRWRVGELEIQSHCHCPATEEAVVRLRRIAFFDPEKYVPYISHPLPLCLQVGLMSPRDILVYRDGPPMVRSSMKKYTLRLLARALWCYWLVV